MTYETIMAGFGGQGILFAGKLMAYCGMVEEKELSWLPSYGPEMRGGTCNCHVIVSDEPISSPFITAPDILMAMNLPSLDKFENAVKTGGAIAYDSSLISRAVVRGDVTAVAVDATRLADEMGVGKLANMVLFGALVKSVGLCSFEILEKALKKTIPPSKAALLESNVKALRAGYEAV
ncbi:MAG: 2-oxoacid:acceptor oxidoreductase family protein [Clostridia bacterium]|nr:2-oxoacid:acceptor oxidoreductase family protein [Clostridia bacterium]